MSLETVNLQTMSQLDQLARSVNRGAEAKYLSASFEDNDKVVEVF